ncbi:MAG: hypothetical protein AAB724_03150, partial [Patescibacteria group bacterium]
SYGIKRVLPRLILVVLLINFSFVFCVAIIDFTQVVANYFINAATNDQPTNLANILMKGLEPAKIYDVSKSQTDGIFARIAAVVMGPDLSVLLEMAAAIPVMFCAAFSFFALAFFLIVRMVWLWLLMIFAPLAWAAFVAPGLTSKIGKGGWDEWWAAFLKWALFAPIYAFFLYLALLIAQNPNSMGAIGTTNLSATAATSPFLSAFFRSGTIILKYIVIMMILLGGLAMAQKGGVLGASAAMGAVKGAGKWAGTKAKNAGRRSVQWGAEKTGANRLGSKITDWAGKQLSNRGFKKLGAETQAKATMMKEKTAASDYAKRFEEKAKRMTNADLALFKAGREGVIAANLLIARGKKDLVTPEQVKNMAALDPAKFKELLEKMPSLLGDQIKKNAAAGIDTKKDQETYSEIVAKNIAEGKKLDRSEKENPTFAKTAWQLYNEGKITEEDLMKTMKESMQVFSQAVESEFGASLTKAGESKEGDEKEKALNMVRERYAKITGDVPAAFKDAGAKIPDYIQKLNTQAVVQIKNEGTLKLVGTHAASVQQIQGLTRGMSSDQISHILEGAKQSANEEIKKYANNTLGQPATKAGSGQTSSSTDYSEYTKTTVPPT